MTSTARYTAACRALQQARLDHNAAQQAAQHERTRLRAQHEHRLRELRAAYERERQQALDAHHAALEALDAPLPTLHALHAARAEWQAAFDALSASKPPGPRSRSHSHPHTIIAAYAEEHPPLPTTLYTLALDHPATRTRITASVAWWAEALAALTTTDHPRLTAADLRDLITPDYPLTALLEERGLLAPTAS